MTQTNNTPRDAREALMHSLVDWRRLSSAVEDRLAAYLEQPHDPQRLDAAADAIGRADDALDLLAIVADAHADGVDEVAIRHAAEMDRIAATA